MAVDIKSRVLKTQDILWRNLLFLQDDDFKEWVTGGDEKLYESVLKYQFIDPFKVWEFEGKLYCLDGKHRQLDLYKAVDSGINVPSLLPATFIDCRDITEAAEMVLLFSSSYARISANGMHNFITKFELAFDPLKSILDLPGLDLDILNDRFLPPPAELVGIIKNKPLTLTITFKSKEQLETTELKVKELVKACEGAFYSVSAGEL